MTRVELPDAPPPAVETRPIEAPAPPATASKTADRVDEMPSGAVDLRRRVLRMRREPRLGDYCYFTARTNLAALRSILDDSGSDVRAVLDVGCGKKPFRPLFPEDVDYVGLDVGGDTDADVVTNLEERWPVADASFDVVLLSEVMEHLGSPEHALAEAARVLRPGGRLFVTTPFAFPLHARPHDFLRFTEFFYRRVPERHPFAIERIDASNSVLTTPVLQTELFLLPVPAPHAVKRVAWWIANAGAALVERVLRSRMQGDGRLASFLRSNPVGYAVVLRRGSERSELIAG